MSECLGTVKILSDRVIINRSTGESEIWVRRGGNPAYYIIYNDLTYHLLDNTTKKDEEPDEIDDDDLYS